MLWLNPFVADMDLVCVTSVTTSSDACLVMSAVTGKPYFGSASDPSACPPGVACTKPFPAPVPGFGVDDAGVGLKLIAAANTAPAVGSADGACPPNARCVNAGLPALDVGPVSQTLTGFPRDTFWPQSALAFLLLSVILTLISARLVMPSRGGSRLLRLRRRKRATP